MPPTLTVCIVAKENIHVSCMISVLQTALSRLQTYIHIAFDFHRGNSNISHARSIAMSEWFLAAHPEDLFMFVDNDQVFDANDVHEMVQLLLSRKSDVVCGVYNGPNEVTNCVPLHVQDTTQPKSPLLAFGATGFMMVTYDICHRIERKILDIDGICRVNIGSRANVIPFFQNRIVKTDGEGTVSARWYGEDYSFCWLVQQVKGTIRSYVSPTLGHEISSIVYLSPHLIDEHFSQIEK